VQVMAENPYAWRATSAASASATADAIAARLGHLSHLHDRLRAGVNYALLEARW